MATSRGQGQKKTIARTAEFSGQTLNVDLCFVPSEHEVERKLPAVSGSSGRLVIEREPSSEIERQWPGRIFEDENRDYTDAMLDYVATSRASTNGEGNGLEAINFSPQTSLKLQKQALKLEEEQLRQQRRKARQQRKQEDTAWQVLWAQRKQEKETQSNRSLVERRAEKDLWRVQRQQRRAIQKGRKKEDLCWRAKRLSLRQRLAHLPIVTVWIAILVITDNSTRQCLGLPLFITGSKVTAELVVEALRVLLPTELQFLISDRGIHFTANIFAKLAQEEEFTHVLIARHRPQSNGIAERFVRTLKEWLRDKSWLSDGELTELLKQFLTEYNNRPHQGLPIPGLSPNEFERRMGLM